MNPYEYDDEEGGRSFFRIGIGALVVIALIGGAWFVVSGRSGDDNAAAVIPADSTESTSVESTVDSTLAPETTVTESSALVTPSTADVTTTTERATTTTGAATTTAAATTTTTAPRQTTTTAAPRPRPTRTYDTLPDGTPVPVVAVFDVTQITLTGSVPDQAAKDRLQALALANAKPGQGNIANFLTINPAVPRSIGVRVVELTSARFPTGSVEIRPEHAAELDRVVSILGALPNVTALVIGHSDQRGDDRGNYVLSSERAEAVINYLAGKGVAPSRLASRAVGETDLLTLNNDAAALALNRRTEFVFYGLLID
jgi:outer membrane protein OmpA-like peptidoglycan-associated protein